MVAPIDTTASFDADGETFTLTMNYRTIALAEGLKADAITGFGTQPTVSGMAAAIWGFARPAHPKLTHDEALALAVRHGAAAGEALRQVIAAGSAPPEAQGDGAARPPARTKGSASTS